MGRAGDPEHWAWAQAAPLPATAAQDAKPLEHQLSSLFEFLCDFSIFFSVSLFVERLIS